MILASGCFDGIHAGHVLYLRAAAQHGAGEVLVVAVAPDAYIRRVKGREPRWSLEDRMVAVQALDMVDRVVAHDDQGVANIVSELHPRLLVKGSDWETSMEPDVLRACQAAGTSVLFVPEGQTPHCSAV